MNSISVNGRLIALLLCLAPIAGFATPSLLESRLRSITLGWRVDKTQDKMSDEVHVDMVQNSKFESSGVAIFGIRKDCQDGELSLILTPNSGGVDDDAHIEIRIDKEKKFDMIGTASADRSLVFITNSLHTSEFDDITAKLKKGNVLLVRYSDLGGKSILREFSLKGLSKSWEKFEKMCPPAK